MAKTITESRSARSGKFVTRSFAESHPSDTVTERNRVGRKKAQQRLDFLFNRMADDLEASKRLIVENLL